MRERRSFQRGEMPDAALPVPDPSAHPCLGITLPGVPLLRIRPAGIGSGAVVPGGHQGSIPSVTTVAVVLALLL